MRIPTVVDSCPLIILSPRFPYNYVCAVAETDDRAFCYFKEMEAFYWLFWQARNPETARWLSAAGVRPET